MRRIYITHKIPEISINLLKRKGYLVEVNELGKRLTRVELKEIFAKYDAIITVLADKIDEEVIKSASSKLRIIANFAVGYDNIDVLAAKRKGIVVANTPGVAGEAVAEHTFMLILATRKKLLEADKYVRQGRFHLWDPAAFLSYQVWGQTIGIIGLGRIGTYVGHIAYGGFRMKILYYDIVRSFDFEMLTGATFTTLEHLLEESDIVTLHVPLTADTFHLIGRKEFGLMKKTSILVNTSRGAVVDEEALILALESGEIAAAGLDVFEHEPSVPSGLTTCGKVILTPHVASATYECREAMAKIAAQNVIDVFEGRTPFGIIKVS